MAVILALRFKCDIRKTAVFLISIYCVHHHSVIPSAIHKPSFMNDKIKRIAIVLMVFALFYPQKLAAEDFTSAELLEWEQGRQDGYFQVSVTMAVFIASKINTEQSTCINDWYFNDTDKKNDYMREKLAEYKNLHPTAIIMASLQKFCGDFK